MKSIVSLGAALSLCTLVLPDPAHAAECDGNFAASGNPLSRQTFTTSFSVPAIQPETAFITVQRRLTRDGMAIRHSDPGAGVLTAWDTASTADRPHVLNVTVEPAQKGARLSLSVSLPVGVFASASGFQKEFCKLAAEVEAATPAPDAARIVSSTGSPAERGTASGMLPGDTPRLCLGKACLGMTLQQALELPLEEQRSAFKIRSDYGDSQGLDSKNRRIRFNTGWVDRKWIRQFSEAVKIPCFLGNAMAQMKASDGEDIRLEFSAAFMNGEGVLQLTRISRNIPRNLSASQWQSFEEQARNRYGTVYDTVSYSHIRPSVHISRSIAGSSLIIAMPGQTAANASMMEQPGCSDRASLD